MWEDYPQVAFVNIVVRSSSITASSIVTITPWLFAKISRFPSSAGFKTKQSLVDALASEGILQTFSVLGKDGARMVAVRVNT